METRFTSLVGCRLPFQLAPLGGVGTTELAAAISAAGGLGMVPYGVAPPDAMLGPAGVGFLMPYLPGVQAVAQAADGVRVLDFFEGDPDPRLVEVCHRAGALASWQVGSVEEAREAEVAGCDLVVVQGVEAGGHVRGRTPLDQLLAQTLRVVTVPVVAAGGIATAARVSALLARGADAVRVGTRFLACPECNTHPAYVQALLAAGAQETVLTQAFDDDGRWPATVRVLAASLAAARSAGNRSTMPPTPGAKQPLAMPCYAGVSVASLTEVQPAADILAELTAPA